MPRQWKVWQKWDGGGFFSGGSYNARERFNALNMQRYQNGSIGPRPGWRKMTQSDFGAPPDSVPSVSNANKASLQLGSYWCPTAGSYIVLVGAGVAGPSKRISLDGTPGTAVYRDAPDLGYHATSATTLLSMYAATQLNSVTGVVENNSFNYVGGSNIYNASTNVLSSVTGRVVGSAIYPTGVCFYKGRMYGWLPVGVSGVNFEYIVFTNSADMVNFNTGDSGAFTLAGTTGGSSTYTPHGLWAVGPSLLIFAIGGSGSFQQPGYGGYLSPIDEHGRWFLLTGPSPTAGTLTPLERDIGPLFFAQSIVHDSKLLFPIDRAGWAVHDGSKIDKTSLEDLRPGRGQFIGSTLWLNPVRTVKKSSLVLPFYTYEVDPTADATLTSDRIGEFWNYGLGAYEFINGAWTEQLYLHGQSDIINHGQFLDDKLFALHLDSSDAGANWFPQIYTRDTTLNRPATSSSQNTYNQYSDGQETAPTRAGGATGDMVCRLETGEFNLPGFSSITPSALVIDYDYWNSALFHSTCGFDVFLIMRSLTSNEKTEQKVNISRITPPGTSLGVAPNRGRAVLNLPARYNDVGSVSIKLDKVTDCAIYSIALSYEGPDLNTPVR